MSASVGEFVLQFNEEYKNMTGFKSLALDLNRKNDKSRSAVIGNDMTAKKILSNVYGTPTDLSLAIAFKKYVIANTSFQGGSYEDAR